MNKLSNDTRKSMVQRIITAIILIIICVPCIIFGNWFFMLLAFVASFFVCHEFINAPKNKSYNLFIHIFVHIVTYSLIFWTIIKNNLALYGWDLSSWDFAKSFTRIDASIIAISVSFLVLFFMTLNHEKFNVFDATYLCTMIIFVGVSVQAVIYIRFLPEQYVLLSANDINNCFFLLYVLLGNFMSDIGAYFFGVLFGKTKMNARISPKKTWEGFIGGVVVSMVVSFLFAFILAKNNMPILPILDMNHIYNIVILSFIMPLTASLGDFIFSSIKRNYNVKDFGTLLKGHGGVLDRVDSLLVTSLVVAILTVFMQNNWSFLA